jgi:hypothetical protein
MFFATVSKLASFFDSFFSYKPTLQSRKADYSNTYIVLPDLVSHCKFPLAYHPNGDEITAQSTKWLIDGNPELSAKGKAALQGLQVRLCSNNLRQ